jgi:hypothetical protein
MPPRDPEDLRLFEPIGHCIYCRDATSKLTLEHIIPFGLGGDMELPKSSCEKCAKITGSEIERECLRTMLLNLRTKYKLSTRRPKERPTQVKVESSLDGKLSSEMIDFPDWHGTAWALPKFTGHPGIVLGCEPSESPPIHVEAHGGTDFGRLHERLRRGRLGQFSSFSPAMAVNIGIFSRMLAKIGHAFAYAMLGPDGFEPCLQEFILKGSPHPSYWIGDEEDIDFGKSNQTVWSIALWSFTGGMLCVRFRIFGFLGTPAYIIAVGKSLNDKFALLKHHGRRSPVEITFAP